VTDSLLQSWFPPGHLSSNFSRFERVSVKKREEQEVTSWHVLDTRTGRLYKDDGVIFVALKCVGLFFVTQYRLYEISVDALYAPSWQESVSICKKGAYYFLGLEFAAIAGVFEPYKGRVLFNDLLEQFEMRPRENDKGPYRAPCFQSFKNIHTREDGEPKYEIVERSTCKLLV